MLKCYVCNPVRIVSLYGKLSFFFLEGNLSISPLFVSVPRDTLQKTLRISVFLRISLFFGRGLSELPFDMMFIILSSIFNGSCQSWRKDGAKGNRQLFVKEPEKRGSCLRCETHIHGWQGWKVLRVISIKLQNQYPLTPASWE